MQCFRIYCMQIVEGYYYEWFSGAMPLKMYGRGGIRFNDAQSIDWKVT